MLLLLSVRYANRPWSRSLALIDELGLLPDGATGDFDLDPWDKCGQSSSFVGCTFSGADPTVETGKFAQPEDLWDGKGASHRLSWVALSVGQTHRGSCIRRRSSNLR